MAEIKKITAAFCTFNRADRLPELISALRTQHCSIPFDIMVVDNNSSDNTQDILTHLSKEPGVKLHFVHEKNQGISHARNRAIEECLNLGSDYMLFMDDDELPGDGLLESAVHALGHEGAQVAGGRVQVKIAPNQRPSWLDDELLGFLAEIDYGPEPLWITERSKPLWTANIAYRTEIFAGGRKFRFDPRYNRLGHAVGGGEDAIIFRSMIDAGLRIRYRPDMMVEHYVEEWRLRRRYFLKLHLVAGIKHGQFQTANYPNTVLGVPLFMLRQAIEQWSKAVGMAVRRKPGLLRQAMNGTHALGMIWGRILRHRQRPENS